MINSGIEWIGEIPENWKLEKLQWHLTEVKETNNPEKTRQILSLTNTRGVIPYEEKGEQGNKAKEDYTQYKLAYPNTIVANSMNVLIGSVGKCEYFGCVSPVYYVFKPNEGENIDFLNYIFQTQQFQKELRRYANGILEIRLRVSSDDILKRHVAIPPIDIQEKIVEVIQQKLHQIDQLIDNQDDQIERLKQYKQKIISELVLGRELSNPDLFADKNLSANLPDGYSIYPLKRLFKLNKGLPITKENLVSSGVKVISYGQVHAKYNDSVYTNEELYRFVNEGYLDTNDESLTKVNDFIFADTSEDLAGIGDCVRITEEDKIFAGYHSIILKANKPEYSHYFSYLFLSDEWRNQFRVKASGVKLFSLTQKMLSQGIVIFPSIDKQFEITKVLDKKCADIKRLIEIKQEKIEKLIEYKKSLIYEYVTGKKQVA